MPKNKKVSMLKTMLLALAAVLLVLVPVRCYQFASGLLEPGTGFYKDVSPSIWVSYILLAAASVAFLIIAIVNRKRISYSTEKFGSTGLAIAAFMFALTLIIDAVMQYKTVFDTATDSAIMYGTESVQYLKIKIAVDMHVESRFQFLCPCPVLLEKISDFDDGAKTCRKKA